MNLPLSHASLLPHQKLVKDFIVNTPYCGVFLTMGSGKTLSTLAALEEIKPPGHILIVAPLTIAKSTWTNEVEKWNIPVNVCSLVVDDKGAPLSRNKRKRLDLYAKIPTMQPSMFIINREMLHDLVDWMAKNNNRLWPFPTVIIDESQSFKNPQSRMFKSLNTVRPAISRLILLTGTPTPNGLLDLWAQIFLIDQGYSLGNSFERYRDVFFDIKTMYNNRPIRWKLKNGAKETIFNQIAPIVISTVNNTIKLPDITYCDNTISLNAKDEQAYKTFKKNFVLELSGYDLHNVASEKTVIDEEIVHKAIAVNSAVLQNKLLQFSSGILYLGNNKAFHYGLAAQAAKKKTPAVNDPLLNEVDRAFNNAVNSANLTKVSQKNRKTMKYDSGDYLVVNTAKLDYLAEMLESADSPVIVAYNFRAEADMILKVLSAKGFDVQKFDGSPEMQALWNAQKIPVMLIQPMSAGCGLNLQDGGHTIIWFSLPYSSMAYSQTNGRVYRLGQKNPVTIHHLIVKNTADKYVLDLLSNKISDEQELIDAMYRDVKEDLK